MVWVFGIVFLTLVVLLAYRLFATASKNRQKLMAISRPRRVLFGVFGSLLSFVAAYLSLLVATSVADWKSPSPLTLAGVLVCMLLFVILQVSAMLCFLSLAIDSETQDDQKRS